MSITISLPEEVERQLRQDWPDMERHALEGFLIEAYRQKRVSAYQVGKLLGLTDYWDAIQFLSERGVYPNYDLEDLEEDRRNLASLEKPATP